MIRLVLAASLGLCGTGASAADAFDWKKTLELPLSAGTVAILVEHGGEPEVQERWRAGLASEDAKVRAATARAIYGAGEKALIPALKEALDKETDRPAAEEQIRALVAVGRAENDAAIVGAARRLPELRMFAWSHLGRARGTSALVHLAAAREGDGPREDRRALVRAAVNGGRHGLSEAGRIALREDDTAAWYVVWDSLLSGGEIGNGILAASVTSGDPRIRAMTYWGAAVVRQHGKVPSDLAEALKTAPEAGLDRKVFPQDASERMAHFAFGLFARAAGGKRQEDLEWVERLPKDKAVWPFPSPATAVAKLFSKEERRRLVELGHLPTSVEERLDRKGYGALWRATPFATAPDGSERKAMIHDFPREYMSGLTALTGCRDREIVGDVAYSPNGRAQSVSLVDADKLSDDCTRTGRILLASRPFRAFSRTDDVRGSAPPPGRETVRLLPLDEATLAWDEGRSRAIGGVVGGVAGGDAPDGPVRVGGTIKDPQKLKHVNPSYPAEARQARVQGVVILEALISVDGRVQDVKVLRSVPMLDEPATEAVRQWVFTPTLLNGVPVPVIYTVTVNFALH